MPTSKYDIIPGKKYGNMTTIERTQVVTKEGNSEWRWKCIDDNGHEYFMRNRALYAKALKEDTSSTKSTEELNSYLENLEKTKQNQMGLRKKYYKEYISNAIKREIPFNLTFDQFNDLISQPCAYCGEEPYIHKSMLPRANMKEPMLKCVGIDRIDSSKFYNLDNCVPCCSKCNMMKNTLETKDFLDHIERIYTFQKNKKESSSTISKESTSEVNADGSGTLLNEDEDIVTS